MSKFDIMLIFVFAIITVIIGMSFYQTTHGLEQFSTGFWTFITAICGGEIVTFSLYRITKEKYERKAEKIAKHPGAQDSDKQLPQNIAPASFVAKDTLITETESAINTKEAISGQTKES